MMKRLARKHWTYSRQGGVIMGSVEYHDDRGHQHRVRWYVDPTTREVEISNTGHGGADAATALALSKALRTAVSRAEYVQAAYDRREITWEDAE
jgi:hypothetical protein